MLGAVERKILGIIVKMQEVTIMTTDPCTGRLGISSEVLAFGNKIEQALKERFAAIDDNAEYNQMKVHPGYAEKPSQRGMLYASSGYGYNDLGRDTLEDVYAAVFHAESALVRPQITCGTHALARCSFRQSAARR